MRPGLTKEVDGTTYLRSGAVPLVIAAICVPVVGAMALGMVTIEGTGLGLAAGALVVTALLVLAARAKSREGIEVASPRDGGRRVLVLATEEVSPEAAQRVAAQSGKAEDVRLVIPLQSRRLDRWLSAEDDARTEAEALLAHSAGALVAAGLPVSGSIGDSDSGQALEDELRSFPADEVIVLARDDETDPLSGAGERLKLPVSILPA